MSYQSFKSAFLGNEYHLSRHWNAAFSASVVAMCIIISHCFSLGMAAAAFIIGAQSVTGVNRQGPFRIRLTIACKAAFILTGSAALGACSTLHPVVLLIAVVLLAFSFGWWRQLFPLNWPDIIIPSGVLFYLNYAAPAIVLTSMGVALGLLLELLLGFFIYSKRYHFHRLKTAASPEVLPQAPLRPDTTIMGLKRYLVLYSVELSLLLTLGTLFTLVSSFPHDYWLSLTIIIVLKVGRHGTLRRVVERTLGTLAGCLLGSAIMYFQLPVLLQSAIMVACIFLWISFFRQKYALGTIFITTFVLLVLSDPSSGLSWSIVLERIVFTAAAGVLVLLSSLIFLKRERL